MRSDMISQREMIAHAKDWHLFPFYITAAFFFIFFQPIACLPEESILAAIFKAVPIWCLATYIYIRRLHPDGTEDPYVPCVMLGLLLSSVGDVFMLFRSSCLHLGVVAFILAQSMYVVGLNAKQDARYRKSVFVFASLFVGIVLGFHEHLDSLLSTLLLCVYFGLIMTVGGMAACRYEKEQSIPSLWGLMGAILFIVSDYLIVVDTVSLKGVSVEFLVMVLYYGAQLCFALSTLEVVRTHPQ